MRAHRRRPVMYFAGLDAHLKYVTVAVLYVGFSSRSRSSRSTTFGPSASSWLVLPAGAVRRAATSVVAPPTHFVAPGRRTLAGRPVSGAYSGDGTAPRSPASPHPRRCGRTRAHSRFLLSPLVARARRVGRLGACPVHAGRPLLPHGRQADGVSHGVPPQYAWGAIASSRSGSCAPPSWRGNSPRRVSKR